MFTPTDTAVAQTPQQGHATQGSRTFSSSLGKGGSFPFLSAGGAPSQPLLTQLPFWNGIKFLFKSVWQIDISTGFVYYKGILFLTLSHAIYIKYEDPLQHLYTS